MCDFYFYHYIVTIILVLIVVTYLFYKRIINNFILRYVDVILIIIVIISLIFYYLDTTNMNYLEYALITGWFFIWLIQYRRNTEFNLFNSYLDKLESEKHNSPIRNLIDRFILLSPLIDDEKNFIQLLKREISKVIEEKDFEKVKEGFIEKLLEIRDDWTHNLLKKLCIELKNEKNKAIKNYKRNEDKEKTKSEIKLLDKFIEIIDKAYQDVFKK